ncbi:BatA domain-containing protein [Stieleria marina]|uniref:Aerotolerance regulator N-terminal domain-containing protein n=1 Tax=Stieleria marina TaxID=1930275 RepID=A0A517NPL0_9BACT|nr:hypothetical protein K239x_10050 [Planctomycetes bacterium K23_9]
MAVAIPIVLHLVARREPKKVVFPSIRFLTKKYENNRSKLQVRRWWLLALRIAALALLALALARPAIHQALSLTWLTIGILALVGIVLLGMATLALSRGQSRGLTYGLTATAIAFLLGSIGWGAYTSASGQRPAIDNASPAAIAIVLDNSPTAAWKTAEDDRLVRIKQIAHWMISRLPPTSRIAIVDRSNVPVTFAMDPSSAIAKVDQLRTTEVTQPISNRIDAAVRLVRTSELENRQLLIISDLAEPTWGESALDPQLSTTIAESPTVPVTFFDLGVFKESNRSLGVPTIQDTTPPAGVPVKLTTVLSLSAAQTTTPPTDSSAGEVLPTANSSADQPLQTNQQIAGTQSVTAELSLYESDPALPVVRNGKVVRPALKQVDRKNAEITVGESRELVLTIPPLATGIHHGTIELIGEDALGLDDKRYFTVEVLPPSQVLLVGDDTEQADQIAEVITSPYSVDDPNAEYQIQRIGYDDLPVVQLTNFNAALLLDPPTETLTDESLAQYVTDGGNVFVCVGPAAGLASVRSDALPTLLRPWRVPEPYTFLNVVQSAHPILAIFSEISDGVPWADFRVRQYWQVETQPSDRVLMRYAGTKHPALIQRIVQNSGDASSSGTTKTGSWVMLTTPIPDTGDFKKQWNDLFGAEAWPAFLLVRFIAESLTGRSSHNWMPTVGQPQLVKIGNATDGIATNETNTSEETDNLRLQLFPPGNSLPVPIDVDPAAQEVVIADVARGGTYWLRGGKNTGGFSANLPAALTRLKRIDVAALSDWFGPDFYAVATNQDEVELAEVATSHRVSLRSPLLLLALAVFLLELILGNRFYASPRRQSSGVSRRSATA